MRRRGTRLPDPLAEEARSRIARARRPVVLTGAGLVRDTAAPAFSDCGTRFGGSMAAEVAAARPFFEDPVAIWRWYDERRRRLEAVQPTAAHRALAEMERRAAAFTLATECVDGLHRLAGSADVLELRGSIWQIRCTLCGMRSVNRDVPIHIPPPCPLCTGLARPGVVWQGEEVPRDLLLRSFEALRRCDLLLIVGSPAGVQPAAAFTAVARSAGASVIEVAVEPPPETSPADILVHGPLGEILPRLLSPAP